MDHHDTGLEHDAETVSLFLYSVKKMFYCFKNNFTAVQTNITQIEVLYMFTTINNKDFFSFSYLDTGSLKMRYSWAAELRYTFLSVSESESVFKLIRIIQSFDMLTVLL